MRSFAHRLVVTLATGYIFTYFSEILFWARPLDGTVIPAIVPLWLLYSLAAFVFLVLVQQFRIRTFPTVILAGALYGWLVEGIFAHTFYAMLPFSISFTGLAWHALLTIGIGWWWLPRALAAPRALPSLGWSSIIGIAYGVWAIGWWAQSSATPVASFAWYSLLTTVGLAGAYGVLMCWPLPTFSPSWLEYLVCGGIGASFFVVTVLALQLLVLVVFLPVVVVTLLLLARARSHTPIIAALAQSPHPRVRHIFGLVLIPGLATLLYSSAWSLDVVVPTSIVWYLVTMPLGFLAYFGAALVVLRQRRVMPTSHSGDGTLA